MDGAIYEIIVNNKICVLILIKYFFTGVMVLKYEKSLAEKIKRFTVTLRGQIL